MNSLTIGTDRVIMFGGFLEGEGITEKIFMYYNDEWSFAGNMIVANSRTTAILIGSSIIVSSGQQSGVIQQFEWDGYSISEGRIVDDVGDNPSIVTPIVIPELFEECERPTNEFIFGAPLKVTDSSYEFTALDLSLSTLDYFDTSPAYFKDVIFEMDSSQYASGYVNYKGQIYLIGGYGRIWSSIYKFTGSTTERVELSGERYKGFSRLDGNNPVVGWQDNQERIFICNFNSNKSCQTFDGSVIRNVEAETVYAHSQGCIGTFERNKEVVVIGGRDAAGKTEIFNGTSWRAGPDHPNNLAARGVAVDVGAGIITIGGYGDLSGYSAYLLTYDNMIENTKKWVDLGRLNSYYVYMSIFRFGEIIVAHRTSLPNAGIYMLTWDGNSLEDHGMQIDLGLIGGSSGIFIPKEKTKCESIFIGDTPQRDTDVEEEIIFEQQCDIRNSDAYVIKFEVECDFDKIQNTNARSYFLGTSNYNFPFRIDTTSYSDNKYAVNLFATGYETIETFYDDVRGASSLYLGEDICTTGDYMEFVIKQWADNEGIWRMTLEIDEVLMARFTSSTAPTSSSIINGRLGFATTDESSGAYRNGLGVKNFSIREY